MPRFDIYRRIGGAGFLVDIQDNLLRDLNTRIVAPLLPLSEAPNPAQRLNPAFEIEGETYIMVTQFLAAVPVAELGLYRGTLIGEDTRIIAAIDILLSGN